MSKRKPAALCPTCLRDPAKVNNEDSECSLIQCPTRGRAWSDVQQGSGRYNKPDRSEWAVRGDPGEKLFDDPAAP